MKRFRWGLDPIDPDSPQFDLLLCAILVATLIGGSLLGILISRVLN